MRELSRVRATQQPDLGDGPAVADNTILCGCANNKEPLTQRTFLAKLAEQSTSFWTNALIMLPSCYGALTALEVSMRDLGMLHSHRHDECVYNPVRLRRGKKLRSAEFGAKKAHLATPLLKNCEVL
jgi:hypothetical protein